MNQSGLNETTTTVPNLALTSSRFYIRDLFVLFLYFLTMAIALIGNSLVCKVVFSQKRMRTTTNILIANMAISDIICALSIPTQWIFCSEYLLDNLTHSDFVCAFGKTMQVLSFYLSSLSVLAIAIDRYHLVHYPLKKRKSVKWMVFFVWISSILFISFTAVSIKIYVYALDADPIINCRVIFRFKYKFISSDFIRHIRVAGVLLTQYFLPLTITLLLYLKIMQTVWRRNVGDMTDMQRQILLATKWRTIKMLILVVVVFGLCWLPVHIFHLIDFYIKPLAPGGCNATTLYLIFYWLGISSCCYNPFIYWWLNDDFRAGLKGFCFWFTCRRKSRDRSLSNSSKSSKSSLISRAKVYFLSSEHGRGSN